MERVFHIVILTLSSLSEMNLRREYASIAHGVCGDDFDGFRDGGCDDYVDCQLISGHLRGKFSPGQDIVS
jgi:hypothetical protein